VLVMAAAFAALRRRWQALAHVGCYAVETEKGPPAGRP